MDRAESKYFNTALRMDQAFLEMLEQKDFAYITVKELCARARVNRSTFYLHHEGMTDLLEESIDYLNGHFHAYMRQNIEKSHLCPHTDSLETLYFITPEYLTPYLSYIRQNKRLFQTALKNSRTLRLDETYDRMFRDVLAPILGRCGVPEGEQPYLMSFYLQGLMAIVTRWIENDCTDPIDRVVGIIQRCIRRQNGSAL